MELITVTVEKEEELLGDYSVESAVTEEAGQELVVIPQEQETIEVTLSETLVDRAAGAQVVTTKDVDIAGGSVGDILQKQPDGTYAPIDVSTLNFDGGTF